MNKEKNCHTPSQESEWEEEFEEKFENVHYVVSWGEQKCDCRDDGTEKGSEVCKTNIKSYIHSLLTRQETQLRERIGEKVKVLDNLNVLEAHYHEITHADEKLKNIQARSMQIGFSKATTAVLKIIKGE